MNSKSWEKNLEVLLLVDNDLWVNSLAMYSYGIGVQKGQKVQFSIGAQR